MGLDVIKSASRYTKWKKKEKKHVNHLKKLKHNVDMSVKYIYFISEEEGGKQLYRECAQ